MSINIFYKIGYFVLKEENPLKAKNFCGNVLFVFSIPSSYFASTAYILMLVDSKLRILDKNIK